MKKIDLDNWDRIEQYRLFSAMAHPCYYVTFKLDVTRLRSYTREKAVSFYLGLTYLSAQAMNTIENFRYKIRGEEVVLVDKLIPSFTDMKKDSELFHIVTCSADGTLEEFCKRAKAESDAQTLFLAPHSYDDDALLYVSSLPWMEMTALSNEGDHNPNNSIPRVTWGKYVDFNGKFELNYAIEVNHRLVDGIHLGKFYTRLQALIHAL